VSICVHNRPLSNCLVCRMIDAAMRPNLRRPGRDDLQLAFDKFDRENPQVYAMICKLADQAIAAGHKKFAIATIYEVMRWETTVTTNSSPFRLSNNHRAFYARKWMQEHPQYPDFFTIKEQDHA